MPAEKEMRRGAIRQAYDEANGVAKDAARTLDVSEGTLRRWAKKLGIANEIRETWPLSKRQERRKAMHKEAAARRHAKS